MKEKHLLQNFIPSERRKFSPFWTSNVEILLPPLRLPLFVLLLLKMVFFFGVCVWGGGGLFVLKFVWLIDIYLSDYKEVPLRREFVSGVSPEIQASSIYVLLALTNSADIV